MTPDPSTRRRILAAGALVLAGLLALAVWVEARSVERANRLFRSESYSDAAALLRQRLEASGPSDLLRYNLGTTLLHLGSPTEAEAELAEALDAADSTVAFRSHHNLGYHMLTGAISHPDQDSAEVMARSAVDLNREALRLDPSSDSTRWNLALSQRALDSLMWLKSGVEVEEVRDSLQNRDPDQAMPALLRELQDDAGILGGHFFSRGEREALARDLAEAPLSEAEANSFLSGMDQSPRTILRRIFLVQSENRWGNFGGSNRRSW